MKYIILVIAVFMIFSCKKENMDSRSSLSKKFDEILFYRISEESEQSLFDKKYNPTDRESIISLLYQTDSDHILDSLKIPQLDMYYQKFNVDRKSLFQISHIFENAGYPLNKASLTMTICEPIYRDVLIFKNKNEKVGFAKICFDCSKNIVLIEDAFFDNSRLHYGELKTILDTLANR